MSDGGQSLRAQLARAVVNAAPSTLPYSRHRTSSRSSSSSSDDDDLDVHPRRARREKSAGNKAGRDAGPNNSSRCSSLCLAVKIKDEQQYAAATAQVMQNLISQNVNNASPSVCGPCRNYSNGVTQQSSSKAASNRDTDKSDTHASLKKDYARTKKRARNNKLSSNLKELKMRLATLLALPSQVSEADILEFAILKLQQIRYAGLTYGFIQ